jgi:hypothetical protein
VITASAYVHEYGLPKSQAKLIEKVSEILGDRAPGDTLLKEIIGRYYKSIKAAEDRRKSGRKLFPTIRG